jgi:hypothetical protein
MNPLEEHIQKIKAYLINKGVDEVTGYFLLKKIIRDFEENILYGSQEQEEAQDFSEFNTPKEEIKQAESEIIKPVSTSPAYYRDEVYKPLPQEETQAPAPQYRQQAAPIPPLPPRLTPIREESKKPMPTSNIDLAKLDF